MPLLSAHHHLWEHEYNCLLGTLHVNRYPATMHYGLSFYNSPAYSVNDNIRFLQSMSGNLGTKLHCGNVGKYSALIGGCT